MNDTPASDTKGQDPLIGRVINDRYKIVSVIARGGMGKVYLAEQAPLGRKVALKVLNPNYQGDADPDFHRRFFLEASTSAKLTHPNTVTVFDYGRTDDEVYYIAMELLEGRTLHKAIRDDAPMSPRRAVHIARQICRSLREAHGLGVIHRDLKPANVYLVEHGDEKDFVKVLDFGLVKDLEKEGEDLTQTGLFMGSPKYMSPEQIRGESLDARSDLYSLGCLLFELVTGRQPFDGPTPISILTQHYEAPIPRITDVKADANVSPAFQAVLDRAMAKKAVDRWPDAEAMRVALEQLQKSLGSKPAEYTPMPVELADKMLSREDFDSFERKIRVQRAVAPIVALLVLGVAGLAAVHWWKSESIEVVSGAEVEPNDQPDQATRIPLGTAVQGSIGASTTDGDRDLYVTNVAAGPHRLSLTGVADLNLTLEVLQLDRVQKEDGATVEKLVRKLWLDDVSLGEGERVDGLNLAEGLVYLRVQERAFCTEPNRPSREKSLVPYTLLLEPMRTEGVTELEPDDTTSTAQPLPLTRAVTAWTGPSVELDELSPRRPDAPFSTADWFRIEGPADATVMVAVVPPERGSLQVVDGAGLETALRKGTKVPTVTVKAAPVWLELKPMADGVRRLRVLAGDETLPGSEYQLAAGMGGDNGLAAVIDLSRALEGRSRLETRRLLLEATRKHFAGSADLTRLGEN